MKDPPFSEVKETLWMLTTVLADITTQVDHLTHGEFCRWPLSSQSKTSAGENLSSAPSACFDPFPQDDPPQMPAQPASKPREARLPPSQHYSVDINLPTPPAPLTQPHINTGSGSSMDIGSIDTGPNPAPRVSSTPCISTPWPGDTCHQG